MGKYTEAIMHYTKASSVFEYAVMNYLKDKENQQLLEEVESSYDYLKNTAFPIIEGMYRSYPDDPDVISFYRKTCRDMDKMQKMYDGLSISHCSEK